jgi:hypothetical protein
VERRPCAFRIVFDVRDVRVIAVDWSGRSGPDQRRVLWLAEVANGELVRLEAGRHRDGIVDVLIREADRNPHLIVGLDFAFSLPEWYVRQRGLTPHALWSALASEVPTPRMQAVGLAAWMNSPEPPFWTTGEAHGLAHGRPEVPPHRDRGELSRIAAEVCFPARGRRSSRSWIPIWDAGVASAGGCGVSYLAVRRVRVAACR